MQYSSKTSPDMLLSSQQPPTSGHGWGVPAVDSGHVVSLDVGNLVHGDVARKRHRQVIAHGQDLTALVLQVVD